MAEVVDSQQDARAQAARAAADAVWRDGSELSARLVFRASRNELRRAGITTPAALYDELKQVFWNADEGVILGDHLSVGFGNVDRRRQVRAFTERHADEPGNVVAKAYEREYGFSAGIAAIWLDLFAEPTDVSVSEWLGVETAERSADDAAARADAPETSDAEREAPTVEGFLVRELAGRICDEGLVRQRFTFEFPDEPSEALDRGIEGAGYYMDHGLLFREGSTPSDHFTRLLAEHPSFAKGDAGFENAVWQHPAFRHVLRQALSDHRVLLYEGDSYISFARLHGVLGARMADIESYAPAVSMDAPEGEPFTVHRVLLYEGDSYISFARLHGVLGARMADIESYAPAVSMDAPEGEPFTVASLRLYEGDSYISFARLHGVLGARMADIESYAPAVSMDAPEGEPFTVASLRAGGVASHPLYGLDMPDDFYEGLLDVGGLLRSCTLAGTKVFVAGGEGRLSAANLVEWIVAHHEGIVRDDLPRLLANDLGITCPAPLLTTTIYNSSVYYDDIGDAYYSSMEAWKKEARNELA